MDELLTILMVPKIGSKWIGREPYNFPYTVIKNKNQEEIVMQRDSYEFETRKNEQTNKTINFARSTGSNTDGEIMSLIYDSNIDKLRTNETEGYSVFFSYEDTRKYIEEKYPVVVEQTRGKRKNNLISNNKMCF